MTVSIVIQVNIQKAARLVENVLLRRAARTMKKCP